MVSMGGKDILGDCTHVPKERQILEVEECEDNGEELPDASST